MLIGGIAAPLYDVSPGQINAQIPFELAPGKQYQVYVNAGGATGTPTRLQLLQAVPGVADYTNGRAIVQHADYSLVTDDSPAAPASTWWCIWPGWGPWIRLLPAAPSRPPAPCTTGGRAVAPPQRQRHPAGFRRPVSIVGRVLPDQLQDPGRSGGRQRVASDQAGGWPKQRGDPASEASSAVSGCIAAPDFSRESGVGNASIGSPTRPRRPPRKSIPHRAHAERGDGPGTKHGESAISPGGGLPVEAPPPGNSAKPEARCRRQGRAVRSRSRLCGWRRGSRDRPHCPRWPGSGPPRPAGSNEHCAWRGLPASSTRKG